MTRCGWATSSPAMQEYHDHVWGNRSMMISSCFVSWF